MGKVVVSEEGIIAGWFYNLKVIPYVKNTQLNLGRVVYFWLEEH
jgi:hypothetical protein